ncbi:MAG: hypothetical protein U1E05_23805, partial [Patescibacteria group bacterium]|nr:hypothetical protein [Patescibacteria group bacterium]
TLVRHAKATPVAVLTDCEPALTVREHIETPVALVLPSSGESAALADLDDTASRAFRLDAAHADCGPPKAHRNLAERTLPFQLGAQHLAVSHEFEVDRDRILEQIAGLSDAFDLDEPFGRIREAISEARKGAR